jgi:hypothetical protein
MEEFKALSVRDTLDALGGSVGAQVSNSDRDYIAFLSGNLGRSTAGNQAVLAARLKIAERQEQVAEMAAKWQEEHGGFDRGKFENYLREWAKRPENRLFPPMDPETKKPIGGAGADGTYGLLGGAGADQALSAIPDKQLKKLPDGRFMDNRGRIWDPASKSWVGQ